MDNFYLDVINAFNNRNVKYLVIGGFAVNFYGYNRTTGDLDLWISKDTSNLANLKLALADLGFDLSIAAMDELQADRIISFSDAVCVVELLTKINISSKISFDQAYERSVTRVLNGTRFHLISLSDLKLEKAKSKRYKDLDDLSKLEEAEAYYGRKSGKE